MLRIENDRVVWTCDGVRECSLTFVLPGHNRVTDPIGIAVKRGTMIGDWPVAWDWPITANELDALGGALRGLAARMKDQQLSACARARKRRRQCL